MHDSPLGVIYEARRTLGLWQNVDLARFLGVSTRTVRRHAGSAGIPLGNHHAKLARALYPVNPELAAKFARACRLDLVELGIAPKPSQPPPARPAATREHALLALCNAADALNLTPRAARPLLANILAHAHALGVELGGLAKLVAEAPNARPRREK